MRKIIIDTDPGVDDAYAIWAALRIANFECLGICTVAGNKSIDTVTHNALRILEYVNKEYISVHQGACAPIKRVFNDAGAVHGKNGLGGVDLPNKATSTQKKSAVDFIVETVKKYPGEIEIIALGPLTNIALAIQKDPNLLQHVKAIWSMGGGAFEGNVTQYAEFNYWADPHALQIVLEHAYFTQLYMVGLDATHKAPFSLDDLMFMKVAGGEFGKTFWNMTVDYLEYQWKEQHNFQVVIHDLLAVLSAENSSLCTFKSCFATTQISGERMGQTVCDFNAKKHNIFVAFDPNVKKYKKRFFELLFPEVSDEYKKYLL